MAYNHSSHLVGEGHISVQIDNFEVIWIGYCNNTVHAKEKLQRLYKLNKKTNWN